MDTIYNERFFDNHYKTNYKVAMKMMPLFLEKFNPKSMVDVGCGRGIFLAEAKKMNKNIEILGIDGEYVNRLLIDEKDFYAYDISHKMNIDKKYDLALSLEVAEHISNEAADVYIENLVNLSDIIVFSAAIPGQGGTGHINEQWPSYWKEKFAKFNYYVSDCLRNIFWQDKDIVPLRRQNILLYVSEKKYEDVMSRFRIDQFNMLDVVHPDLFKLKVENINLIANTYKGMLKRQELVKNFSHIDYEKAAKQLSVLDFWNLVDEIDLIEELMENEVFLSMFTCYQLEEFSRKYEKEDYIIWGAGDDGKKIERLLKVLKKKIVMWCDQKQSKMMLGKREIISPKEMFENYKNEIIVIASRKYQSEITNEIISFDCNLKDSIFNIGEI